MASEYQSLEWHQGENLMHSLLHTPERENPSTPGLSPYGIHIMMRSPLCALGTLDDAGQPWTTLLGGEPAFTRPIGHSVIGIKTLVDRKYDPVVELLVGGKKDGEVLEQNGGGRVVSGLPIDLMTRSRLKISGKMVAGALGEAGVGAEKEEDGVGEIQLVIKIDHSLGKQLPPGLSMSYMRLTSKTGNCPKYLNKKEIVTALPEPVLISNSLPLPDVALNLLSKADAFFISSSHHGSSMGTNYRGGPSGFVRVLVNDDSGTTLVFPEYSGNRLYQTLGNLQMTPKAGLVFPDFGTQDVLYVTGKTEILIGEAAAALLPRSNLVVKLSLTAARFVQKGLAFRGIVDEFSPYNPQVRFLPTEKNALLAEPTANNATGNAQLVKIEIITPTIIRARFKFSQPKAVVKWNPGNYVALSFEAELSAGYSHMRDSDPRSLNDDFIRTFTISSPPSPSLPDAKTAATTDIDADEFEITLRVVGVATRFLSRQQPRSGLSLPLKGFGGSFTIPWIPYTQIPFVAGGIGITPLLAHLPSLSLATSTSLRLFWMINISDVNLVLDTFRRYPVLVGSLTRVKVFISGLATDTVLRPPQSRQLQSLYTFLSDSSPGFVEESPAGKQAAIQVFRRRLTAADIATEFDKEPKIKTEAEDKTRPDTAKSSGSSPNDPPPASAGIKTWYICTAPAIRKEVLAWLAAIGGPEGSIKPVYEDFGY